MTAFWKIEKEGNTGTFWLEVGTQGVPGSHRVNGLTGEQARLMGDALLDLERRAEYRALERVRDALGVRAR